MSLLKLYIYTMNTLTMLMALMLGLLTVPGGKNSSLAKGKWLCD